MLQTEVLNSYLGVLQADLWDFAPELILSGAVVVMLVLRTALTQRTHMRSIAIAAAFFGLLAAAISWQLGSSSREMFQGMLIYDSLTQFFRVFLMLFAVLMVFLTMLTGIPDAEDSADFYTLLFGSLVGMSLMASANHLLMVFIAVEMASVPSYALAGFLKGRRQSSEAALKYVVYGGAAAGVMLYGISLLAGMYGSLHLPTLAREILYDFTKNGTESLNPALLMALVLVFVGLAFKLSAFPFHFWCPDVFEGAAAEVAAFLSIASKGAAIALVIRITMMLIGRSDLSQDLLTTREWAVSIDAFGQYLSPILAVIAIVTCTFGNLAAYNQTNLKRLLAYSTIAHAGYMMLALVPMTGDGAKAALFYLMVYLFMNLGAFAVVAFLRNQTGSEEIDAYRGLIQRAPVLAIAMSVFLMSLLGMPPFGGFVAKFQVFYVLFQSGWITLLVLAGINTVISLVYYINVVRVMTIVEPEQRTAWYNRPEQSAFVGALAAVVLALGLFWQTPEQWSIAASESLRHPTERYIEVPSLLSGGAGTAEPGLVQSNGRAEP